MWTKRIVFGVLVLLLAFEEGLTKKKTKKKVAPLSAKKSTGNFFVGKLSATSTSLEYEALDGQMTPKKAQSLCDQDLSCAGFTYKGAKGHGQKFQMKFFRYISKSGVEAAKKSPDWTWTSYRVARPYVLLSIQEDENKGRSYYEKEETTIKALLSMEQWPDNDCKAIIFNPMLGQVKKVKSQEKFSIKDSLPSESKSSWMMAVNLDTEYSLFNKSLCGKDNDKNFRTVHKPSSGCDPVGAKQLQDPVIYNNEDCSVCLENEETKIDIFDLIANVSSWSLATTGKSVKRSSISRASLFKAHLRATVHDRSAFAIKKMIVNAEDLAPFGHEADLATKLGLRRSSQLFLDYWPKGNASSFLLNPPGTSTTFFYIHGKTPMDWILVPTNARVDLQTLTSCHLSPDLKIHGRAVQKGRLHPGEMIYVPQGWSYMVRNEDIGAITIAEARLTPDGLEEAAASYGEQEIHGLKKALEDPFWHLWRRFTEILRQRKRSKQ